MSLEHFDIAHYTGHKAIEELSKCYRLFAAPVDIAVEENGVQIQSFDFKKKADYSEKLRQINILQLDINNIDYINAFHFANYIRVLSQKELEYCINSAIYFQVMMEADINDVDKSKHKFKNRWFKFMKENNADEIDISNFDSYFRKIYLAIRVPAVHPKQRIGIRNLQIMNFVHVYENIKKGWFAFVFLLNKTRNLQLDYHENWKIMCNSHNLPESINAKQFPNLEELVKKLHKKHIDGINESL